MEQLLVVLLEGLYSLNGSNTDYHKGSLLIDQLVNEFKHFTHYHYIVSKQPNSGINKPLRRAITRKLLYVVDIYIIN